MRSERGGREIRPAGAADSTVVEIGPWGGYREHTGGSTMEGRYRLTQGRMYQVQDTAFVVLVLDSSRFFPRSAAQPLAVAVRTLAGDTLVLSGTGTDASLYTFVRVSRPR